MRHWSFRGCRKWVLIPRADLKDAGVEARASYPFFRCSRV